MLKIKTDAVSQVSACLRQENNAIQAAYAKLYTGLKDFKEWEGAAADEARKSLRTLNKYYAEGRYQTVENFSTFLDKTVAEGYVNLENLILKNAKPFR